MHKRRCNQRSAARGSLLVFFFFFVLLVLLGEIAVRACFTLFFLVVFVIVQILGDDVEVNGMGLRDFELGFTFRATKDLALFHFVFVNVDFGGTLGAADHGSILRRVAGKLLPRLALPQTRAPPSSVLYTAMCEVNCGGLDSPPMGTLGPGVGATGNNVGGSVRMGG